MSRATLAVMTVVVGVALALTAVAGAATHGSVGATRWTITDLGTFGPDWTSGSAAAINLSSQVVGTNGTAGGKQHAFLWQNGKMTDLGTLAVVTAVRRRSTCAARSSVRVSLQRRSAFTRSSGRRGR